MHAKSCTYYCIHLGTSAQHTKKNKTLKLLHQSFTGFLHPRHVASSAGSLVLAVFAFSRHLAQVNSPAIRQKLPTMGKSHWEHLKHSGCHARPGLPDPSIQGGYIQIQGTQLYDVMMLSALKLEGSLLLGGGAHPRNPQNISFLNKKTPCQKPFQGHPKYLHSYEAAS